MAASHFIDYTQRVDSAVNTRWEVFQCLLGMYGCLCPFSLSYFALHLERGVGWTEHTSCHAEWNIMQKAIQYTLDNYPNVL